MHTYIHTLILYIMISLNNIQYFIRIQKESECTCAFTRRQ